MFRIVFVGVCFSALEDVDTEWDEMATAWADWGVRWVEEWDI
jgi:hypothetical protein